MLLNPAESLVARLCSNTFFRLWSVPNPVHKPGKELCDLIVVCDPDVLVWSVKDITYSSTESEVGLKRWQKKAIDASIKQLRGAKRSLASMSVVSSPTAINPLPLPPTERRSVHLLAVALGSRGEVSIYEPSAGDEHFHVLEESALETLLAELDTVTDFVSYLKAKEAFLKTAQVVQTGSEQDLLGLYLHRGRTFPTGTDLLIVEEGVWADVTAKPEWSRRKEADAVSYAWDHLIETFVTDHEGRSPPERQSFSSIDAVLRTMARESRFARRMLGGAFEEFIRLSAAGLVRARQALSPSGVVYVFLAVQRENDRQARVAELAARCWVARGMHADSTTIVGIATERYQGSPGFSFDAVQLVKAHWTEEDEHQKMYLQEALGYFRSPQWSKSRVEEFPDARKDAPEPPQ